jgi:hypothetical protein
MATLPELPAVTSVRSLTRLRTRDWILLISESHSCRNMSPGSSVRSVYLGTHRETLHRPAHPHRNRLVQNPSKFTLQGTNSYLVHVSTLGPQLMPNR